jgi:hypothetical protein
MKKILFIALCFVAFNSKAQSIDTVKNAIQVQPVQVNSLKKDTCYQVTWTVFGVNRNDSSGANSYVQFFDRKANKVSDMNIPIPYSIISVWLEDVVIDDYILSVLGLTKK